MISTSYQSPPMFGNRAVEGVVTHQGLQTRLCYLLVPETVASDFPLDHWPWKNCFESHVRSCCSSVTCWSTFAISFCLSTSALWFLRERFCPWEICPGANRTGGGKGHLQDRLFSLCVPVVLAQMPQAVGRRIAKPHTSRMWVLKCVMLLMATNSEAGSAFVMVSYVWEQL